MTSNRGPRRTPHTRPNVTDSADVRLDATPSRSAGTPGVPRFGVHFTYSELFDEIYGGPEAAGRELVKRHRCRS